MGRESAPPEVGRLGKCVKGSDLADEVWLKQGFIVQDLQKGRRTFMKDSSQEGQETEKLFC